MEDLVRSLNILYEDNHIIVVEKPVNIPTCEDSSKDFDLLSIVKKYIKEKYNKPGNVYVGLIHRLDRPVGGIMVFARTSKAATRLNEQVRNDQIVKKYYAVVIGSLEEKNGKFEDYLIKDNKTNTVRVGEFGKYALLEYKVLSEKENMSLVEINLHTGRSHQIRVQFSSRNHPLYGDQRYNKKANCKEQIALYSYFLSFKHPITKEVMKFKLNLPNRYPFEIFNLKPNQESSLLQNQPE